MAVLRRLIRVVIAAVLLVGVLYLTAQWTPDPNSIPLSMPGSLEVPSTDSTPKKSGPAEDAHKLETADSFLYHFQVVMQQPGLTMEQAKAGCQWPMISEVNFQYGDTVEWVVTEKSDEELDTRRKEWHDFINTGMVPYKEHAGKFEGRGIVIVAGDSKSLSRVRVILKSLTRLGSKMPIELHYWADEMTEESQKQIGALWPNMYFNNLTLPSNIFQTDHDRLFQVNYQLKTAAVLNSRFAEPLLLDSDNIPVIDPETLYESKTYREYGTLFWPDIARTRPQNPIWAISNTVCKTDEYEQESGQLIVDKRKYWYHLQLAFWLNNNHGDYYNEFLLGDKDTFRFAWHALKTKYGAPRKWITSVGTLNDGYYCGHSFGQHHPDDGRIAFMHGGLLKTMTKEVMQWQREKNGGVFQVYKRSPYDERHNVVVHARIKWDPAKYYPDRTEDFEIASCTDYDQVTARPLDELLPGFEKHFEEGGGYWMLDGTN